MKDRHRFFKLVPKVASAVARRVELWDGKLVISPALAARAAVLAFGDELIDLKLPNDADSQRLSQGGRDMAAAHLLPRPRCARSCSGWPTPSRELAKARANPQAACARYYGPRACFPRNRFSTLFLLTRRT